MKKENKDSKGSVPLKKYFIYFFVVLIFVQILDTYNTHYLNLITSHIIDDFLGGYSSNQAASIMSFCIAIASFGTYIVFFNQFLADRIGRKVLLVFTVFGMAIVNIFILLSENILQYTIALFILYFFFSSDIWAIYINEESPQEKRGFWTNMLLLGGIGGAIIIPILRSIFLRETGSNWKNMTLFPIILGLILGVIILFSIKESSMYNEMKEEKISIEATFKTLKVNLLELFKSSQRNELIAVIIISLLSGLNYTFISLGETYASNSPYLSQSEINILILVATLCVFIGYLLTGLIIDRLGRKPLIYIYSILLPIAILIFIGGCNSPVYTLLLVCIGAGMVYAIFWGLVVVMRVVIVEITPTEARGTGTGFRSLAFSLGMTMGLFLGSLITNSIGLAWTFIIFSFLPLLINTPINYFLIKETKDESLRHLFKP